MDENKKIGNDGDREIINYFTALKQTYAEQRLPWEQKWVQANEAYLVSNKLDKVYTGRANVNVPIINWKVDGIVARVIKIIFNAQPFGRIENPKEKPNQKNLTELWNKYIFEKQLPEIDFKQAYKIFTRSKTINGTAIAKVTQEYETKEFTMFDDEEPEEVVIKDNTYFRPMLLTEFYSDVNCPNIHDSQANIQSSTISMEVLRKNKKRIEIERTEVVDKASGEVIAIEEKRKEVGVYENLNLLEFSGVRGNLTEEQAEYIQMLGLNKGQVTTFQKSLEATRKTGFIQLDECYGLYDLDGDGYSEEVLVTIANGLVVIRAEPTPFKHKRLIRPFIRGVHKEIQNCLYGLSNVVVGASLLQELNASRSQVTDSKTQSVFPMWYMDTTKQVSWDKVWRPNGVIKGAGQLGMTPIINPNLSNVSIQDSELIQRDLDQLWSLSPVQEGTSDNRFIPQTARGTAAIISQNDMPLNDLIDTAVDNELKPFIEMLYERNIAFKDVKDLLDVWTEEELAEAGVEMDENGNSNISMKDLYFAPNIKILGTMELSNEIAHQQGWTSFIGTASAIPPLAGRLDWTEVADRLLRSYGIKDDSKGIFISEEKYQQSQMEQQKAQSEAAQSAMQQDMSMKQQDVDLAIAEHKGKKEIDTEAEIVKMQAEATLEKVSGEKVK